MKDDAMGQTIVYDVFVNFSEDTANGFSAHLRGALGRHGFTLFDHTMLPSGLDVGSELLKAIKKSGIYVVVFSVKYAHSERCLDELVNICFHKSEQRKVLPVFFNVEPSDVRKQMGSYEEAFTAYEANFDRERVQKWRQAMEDAGGLAGYHLQNGNEEKFTKKIVKELENMQNPQKLYVARHPVGISSRVEELISYLEHAFIVAVLGIGGIGKTTIVKATYNRIAAKFEASCFLADIQDYRHRKVDLQNELISSLSQYKKYPVIRHHNERITKIKNLISRRKVLLVLDGVDKFERLEILGIDPEDFHHGSRIIVTTRDKSSLGFLPYTPYHTRLLNYEESLELFTWLTFEQDLSVDQKLVNEIVWRAAGLPLVVEVWSALFRHLERELWPSQLKTLIRIPHDDVHSKLRMSYDLLDHGQKKLFLDIACFFCGECRVWDKNSIVKILKDEESPFCPDLQFRKLVDKCLVEVGKYCDEQVSMHQAIQDMGREIVRQENEEEPGERSRLWDYEDVVRVLKECSGTTSVQSISLSYGGVEEEMQVEALRKMSNLRLIEFLPNIRWSCSNDSMPPLSFKKLKYLYWFGFPLKCINIDMPDVVEVWLRSSKLEILWDGIKSFKKLRILDVSYSCNLTKTANFSKAKNLEELNFEGCENLEELHNSVGCLDKLVILNLRDCKRLRRFPTEVIGKLRSLQTLDLTNCTNIGLEHDDVIDHLFRSLKECPITDLFLRNCNILRISDEVGSLTWLKHLDLSVNKFPSLPDGLGKLHQLKTINLSDCASMHSIAKLPDSLSNLSRLSRLYINDCPRLWSLPLLPSNLESIQAIGCGSLDVMPFASVQKVDTSLCLGSICSSSNSCNHEYELSRNVLQRYKKSFFTSRMMIRLSSSGYGVPKWCTHQSRRGDILSFVAPQHLDKKIFGLILCIITTNSHNMHSYCRLHNKTKETCHSMEIRDPLDRGSMHVKFYPLDDTTLVVEAGDTVVLKFDFDIPEGVQLGLCLIYDI